MTPFRYSKGLNHILDYSGDEEEREEECSQSNPMKLTDMTTGELLEAIDLLHLFEGDPEQIYQDRSKAIAGPEGDAFFAMCQKYREPLMEYVYREVNQWVAEGCPMHRIPSL